MLVDDEALVCIGAALGLRRIGYAVETAFDGEAAARIYAMKREQIDVILLDLSMPRMGGMEALEVLKRIDPEVRVVICTGHSNPEMTRDMIGQGALAVLTKPFSLREVTMLLEQLRNGGWRAQEPPET